MKPTLLKITCESALLCEALPKGQVLCLDDSTILVQEQTYMDSYSMLSQYPMTVAMKGWVI